MSEHYKNLQDPEDGSATSASHAPQSKMKNRTIRLALLGVLVVVLIAFLGGFIGGLTAAFNSKHDSKHLSMQPKELFVSAGHNASTAVNITWVTENADAISCGQFGISPDALNTHVCGKKQHYTFDSAKFGHFHSPTFHYITLNGLIPNTKYFYSVGDNQTGSSAVSKIYSFRTASVMMQKTAFTIVGDLGQTKYSAQTVERMKTFEESEVILHVGDMSYADTNQQRWSSWANMVEHLSATKQWMVVPGNHEIESQSGTGLCFVPYETRFNMPSLAPPVNEPVPELANCEWWEPGKPYPTRTTCCPSVLTGNTYDFGNAFYSFDVASVHVLVLNSYTNSSRESIQYRWAENQLKLAATRTDHPWIVVMMHCPFYNSNKHHENETQAVNMKASMEDLFLKYNVTLVLAGHVHAYERTHRIAHGQIDKNGIYYVTMGDGGNREGHARPFLDPKPAWSDKRNDTLYGHARVHVENQTHLHWQWFPTPDDPTMKMQVADDIWITRDV